MTYSSDRLFKIWAYTVSHSFLLLRSTLVFEDVKGYSSPVSYNIDIEFWGVAYLDIPDMFRGIAIREIKEGIPNKVSKFASGAGYKVFEIKSDQTYYLVAANYVVATNTWITESRISHPDLKYDKILATS